ncbi:MAG: DUF929 family protein [Candidatus Micrarchaeota archaeon]|nr:DUF929 family protein [Candidatus Micrarchaeota archaeon]
MEGTIEQQPQQTSKPKPSIFSNKKVLYGAIVVIILIVVAALVLTGGRGSGSASQLTQFDGKAVSQAVLSQLAIPGNVSSTIRAGFATNFPTKVSAPPLSINGKPEILYIGAEYCPFCAVHRWALVIALMRFGTFTGLNYMTSSATDSYPNTPTFTFANSAYSSPYISFVSRELTTNLFNSSIGGYPTLQQLNASQQAIFSKFNSGGSIPFTDYANESIQVGSNFADPTVLDNMNWSEIANLLQNPSSTQAQALVGSANLMTAQICKIDNNTPQSVCGQSYISSIESQLS